MYAASVNWLSVNLRRPPTFVFPYHRQLVGVDFIDVAIDVDMFRSALRFPPQLNVVFQRGNVIADANALALVEVGNVRLMLVFAGGDDPSGREGGPAAVGVMHDNDVF